MGLWGSGGFGEGEREREGLQCDRQPQPPISNLGHKQHPTCFPSMRLSAYACPSWLFTPLITHVRTPPSALEGCSSAVDSSSSG